jgi:magnesium transporter
MSHGKPSRKRYATKRRTPPGTPPGTLVPAPDAKAPAMRVYAYGPDVFEERSLARPDDVGMFVGKSPVVWLDVDGVGDEATISRLGELLGLHRLALEDVVSAGQRPKLEPYADRLFLVLRMLFLRERLEGEQLSLFLGPGLVVTFQEGRPGDSLEPVRKRLREGAGALRSLGADFLAYALVDAVIDGYFPVLEEYGERLETLEDDILDRPGADLVGRLHAIKRDLLTLRRAVWPLREVLAALERDPGPLVGPETRVYLRDCYDHAIRVIDLVETYRELCADLMDVYLSSVSNRLNDVMRVLTVFSAIFIPLTFIAGVYGMNFHPDASPWNMPELDWRWGYPFALGLMLAVAVGLLAFFARKGWLRSFSKPRNDSAVTLFSGKR